MTIDTCTPRNTLDETAACPYHSGCPPTVKDRERAFLLDDVHTAKGFAKQEGISSLSSTNNRHLYGIGSYLFQ